MVYDVWDDDSDTAQYRCSSAQVAAKKFVHWICGDHGGLSNGSLRVYVKARGPKSTTKIFRVHTKISVSITARKLKR